MLPALKEKWTSYCLKMLITEIRKSSGLTQFLMLTKANSISKTNLKLNADPQFYRIFLLCLYPIFRSTSCRFPLWSMWHLKHVLKGKGDMSQVNH